MPEVVSELSGERVLVMGWMAGAKLSEALARDRPWPRHSEHARRTWPEVFKTLHEAWGAMIFELGEVQTSDDGTSIEDSARLVRRERG